MIESTRGADGKVVATTLTGKDQERFGILSLRSALKLEAECGIQMTRGASAYAITKKRFGFKGNKASVLAQLNAHIDAEVLPRMNTDFCHGSEGENGLPTCTGPDILQTTLTFPNDASLKITEPWTGALCAECRASLRHDGVTVTVRGQVTMTVNGEEVVEWTQADQDAAYAEGWALFNYPEGDTDLEKDDEAAKFPSDDEALEHVAKRAMEKGGDVHMKALRAWKRTNPTGYAEALAACSIECPIEKTWGTPTNA